MGSLISFFEWFAAQRLPDGRPWLILGKGPSFARKDEYDLSAFHLLSLNHVVREIEVLLAHLIDFDVVGQVGDALGRNARFVVMPWVPHVQNRPGEETLEDLVRRDARLRELAAAGRLLWYNLDSAPPDRHRPGAPVIPARYFSAEAALNLLARAGVDRVRSLGIDGGTQYARRFDDLAGVSLLANQRDSFDAQFREIARTIRTTGVDYAPLTLESPIRVYVGSQAAQRLPTRVLEYSIRKHTSMTVEVQPLHETGDTPVPRDPRHRPRTPFAFQRFRVPAAAGRTGRAIYLDSDMQVFADLRLLWAAPFDGADVLAAAGPESGGRRPQLSVMLLDCARLDWNVDDLVRRLDEGRITYEELLAGQGFARPPATRIPFEWNSLEHFEAGRTCLLHYTDMDRQPWLTTENPLGHLWVRDLLEAIDEGFLSRDEVAREVELGHVRPSLLFQIDRRIEDACRDNVRMLRARTLDAGFRPPGGHDVRRKPAPWKMPHRVAATLAGYALSGGETWLRATVRRLRAGAARSGDAPASSSS